MIFELLDAHKKRISQPTGEVTFEGMIRQDMNDRVVKDSLEIDFDISLYPLIQKTSYIYLGDNNIFRVSPLYKVASFRVNNGTSIRVTGLPQAMERLDEVKLSWEGIIEGTTRVDVVVEDLHYERKFLPNSNLFEGDEEVYQHGEDGEVERTYVVGMDYGEEIDRLMIKEVILKPAKDLIIHYGTKNTTYTEIETEFEELWYDYEFIENPEKPVWEYNNIQEGENGEVMVTYEVTYENGYEVSRVEIDREVVKEVVNYIDEMGTNPNSYIDSGLQILEDVPYEVTSNIIEELPEGYEYVIQEGVNGKKLSFYNIYYLNDIEVKRTLNYEVFNAYPIDKEIIKGNTLYEYETEVVTESKPAGEDEYIYDSWMPVGEENVEVYGQDGVKGVVLRKDTGDVIVEVDMVEAIPTLITKGTGTTRYFYEWESITTPYQTYYYDAEWLPEGEQYTEVEGIDGVKEVEWSVEEEYIDGIWVEVYRNGDYEYIIQEVQDEIIYIGTGTIETQQVPMMVNATVGTKTLSKSSAMGFLTYISTESEKIGYELDIVTTKSEDYITKEAIKYLELEFTLGDAIRAITQVIDGTVEFGTEINGDSVSMVTVHINDSIGKKVITTMDSRTNIEDYNFVEQREKVVTAIEFTGMVINSETGEELTLKPEDDSLYKEYTLPVSGRKAYLEEYVDSLGVVHYILEDKEATSIHGNHTPDVNKIHPVIERHSNSNIYKIEDLIQEAIKELDGKNLPTTQYRIMATIKDVNVMDYVRVKIPEINIDVNMPVLTVEYDIGNLDFAYITVGEHIPTALDRIYEELPKTGGRDGGRKGETVYVLYQSYGVGYSINLDTGITGTKGVFTSRDKEYENPDTWENGNNWRDTNNNEGLFTDVGTLERENWDYARKVSNGVVGNRVLTTLRHWSVSNSNHDVRTDERIATEIPEYTDLPKWVQSYLRNETGYYYYIYYDRSRRGSWNWNRPTPYGINELANATENDYNNGTAFRINNYEPLKLLPESYNLDVTDYRLLGGLGRLKAPRTAIQNVVYELSDSGEVIDKEYPFTHLDTSTYANEDSKKIYYFREPFIPTIGSVIAWTYRYADYTSEGGNIGLIKQEVNEEYNYPGWLAYVICMFLGVEYNENEAPEEFKDWNRRYTIMEAQRTDNIQPDGRSFNDNYQFKFTDRATFTSDITHSSDEPTFMPYIWFSLEEAKWYDQH